MIRMVIDFDPSTGQVVGINGSPNILMANFILDKAKAAVLAQQVKFVEESVAVPTPELADRLLNGRA